jgi:hypothetical protein
MAKEVQKYRPGLKAHEARKGADGWCVFCDAPVTKTEYKDSHYGGKCQRATAKKSAAANVPVVSERDLEIAHLERLAKSAGDRDMWLYYAKQLRQLKGESK